MIYWDKDTYLHINRRKPQEFWGALWNSLLLIFCYLTIHRAVSLLRAHIEAPRYCKSTAAWPLPPCSVRCRRPQIHLACWGSEVLVFATSVFFKGCFVCLFPIRIEFLACSVFRHQALFWCVFLTLCFPHVLDCQNHLKTSDFYDQVSLGNNFSLIHWTFLSEFNYWSCQEPRMVVCSCKHLACFPCSLGSKRTKTAKKLGDGHSLPKDPFQIRKDSVWIFIILIHYFTHDLSASDVPGICARCWDIQLWTRQPTFMEVLITGWIPG